MSGNVSMRFVSSMEKVFPEKSLDVLSNAFLH